MSTPANRLTAEILVEIPKRFPHVRIWRQNTGAGVGMNEVRRAIECLRIGDIKGAIAHLGRPMKFGVVGGGDLSGIVYRAVDAAFPKIIGQRIEVEVKVGKDKQSDEQRAFAQMLTAHGGLYIVARSVEDVVRALAGIR